MWSTTLPAKCNSCLDPDMTNLLPALGVVAGETPPSRIRTTPSRGCTIWPGALQTEHAGAARRETQWSGSPVGLGESTGAALSADYQGSHHRRRAGGAAISRLGYRPGGHAAVGGPRRPHQAHVADHRRRGLGK